MIVPVFKTGESHSVGLMGSTPIRFRHYRFNWSPNDVVNSGRRHFPTPRIEYHHVVWTSIHHLANPGDTHRQYCLDRHPRRSIPRASRLLPATVQIRAERPRRKFFYLFTCEYCFSHYVAALFLLITRFKLLYPGWRGYLVALFALVWVANQYMSIYNRLRLDIKSEQVEIKEKELVVQTRKAA